MADRAVEAKKARYPQQHVREGRGVAGYSGPVEVYPTKPLKRQGRVVANAAGDITQLPEKIDANRINRDQLESIALQRGLTQEQIDGATTKAELLALIEAQ